MDSELIANSNCNVTSRREVAKTAKYGATYSTLVAAFKASPLMKQWQQAPKAVRDMVMRTINAIP